MTHIEDRLRSFARLITQNFHLKVHFVGTIPSITTNQMFIPPLEDTPLAFQRAKFHVAHECGHDLFTVMHLKEKANEVDIRLGDILNSLEDARIERLMVEKFEGLKDEFEVNVKQITDEIDFEKLPLHQQVLHGMYLEGTGMDIDFLSTEAKAYLAKLSPLIAAAVTAKDTYDLSKISEKIYEVIKGLFPPIKKGKNSQTENEDDEQQSTFRTIPEHIAAKLDAHKVEDSPFDWDKYINCIDGVLPEALTIREVKTGSLSDYLRLIKSHLNQQSYLIQNIKQLVEKRRSKKRRISFSRNQKSGVVDTRSLWKIATDETAIFKTRQKVDARVLDIDPNSLAFYLLFDMSFSMKDYNRIQYAKEAVAVFGEVLNNLGIPFAITGYSSYEALRRYIFKTFDESYLEVRSRLVNADYKGNTLTSEQIPFAHGRLVARTEKKKVLVVITDADHIESHYRLTRAIDNVKSDGIEVIGIGICTNLMSQYFDRFIQLNDLTHLGGELLSILRDVLR